MKITIKDIKEKYIASKSSEKRFLWTYYVRRPISYYLALPFIQLGVSANKITLIWLIIGVIGSLLLASGEYITMIIGISLIELALILDCVDGHVARFSKPTAVGYILDDLAGTIIYASSMFTLGVGLSKQTTLLDVLNIPHDNYTLIYLGFMATLIALLSWGLKYEWKWQKSEKNLIDIEVQNRQSSTKILFIDNIFNYSGAYVPFIGISIILHLSDVALALVTIVYMLYLVMLAYNIFKVKNT